MITSEDIEAFEEFNEPLNEKESEEKEKKLKSLEEDKDFLFESRDSLFYNGFVSMFMANFRS